MKTLLASSIVLIVLASSFLFLYPQASAIPVSYNQTAISIPWHTVARHNYDMFISTANNGTIDHWYSGTTGGSTLPLQLGKAGLFNNNFTATSTIGDTSAFESGFIGDVWVSKMTGLVAGGTITTEGIDIQSDAGNYRLKIYADDGGAGSPGTLLAQTNSATGLGVGFHDIALISSGIVPASGTIYVGFETDSNAFNIYKNVAGGNGCFVAHAFGAGPNPFGGCSANTRNENMRITYSYATTSSALGVNCALSNSTDPGIISIGADVYYGCSKTVYHVNALNGTSHHDFSSGCTLGQLGIFAESNHPSAYCFGTGSSGMVTNSGGNRTIGTTGSSFTVYSSSKIGNATFGLRTTANSTLPVPILNANCELLYNGTILQATQINSIGCDRSIPANIVRYYNGLGLSYANMVRTNSTLQYFANINSNAYKHALSLPSQLLGIPTEDFASFIFHNGTNYMIVVTANNIYYADTNTINRILNANYAYQSYLTTTITTDSNFAIPHTITSITTPAYKLYNSIGGINTTITKFGLFGLLSGYNAKGSTVESTVRTMDPQWTNNNNNIPFINTGAGSSFPIALTVSNAPSDASVMFQSASVVIGGISDTWLVTQLDVTHSAETDIPAGECPSVYVANIAVSPAVYVYQGLLCATGTNVKSIQYTQTLPLSFYSSIYGATSNYSPVTNGLQTIVRATNSSSYVPFTYNVIVKNSTGKVALNQTFTSSTPLDTRNFNVSGVSKTASLFISVNGKQLYSAYLGSSISFASVVSFFHQYLSYQGFDLLAFIPIVFASMFTRNTVGIGMAMTVVMVASMSWLSITVVSDTIVYISILVAIIGMIGYRAFG